MSTTISNVFEERGWILYESVYSIEDSVTPFFERVCYMLIALLYVMPPFSVFQIVALNIRINNINAYPDFAYSVLCEVRCTAVFRVDMHLTHRHITEDCPAQDMCGSFQCGSV